MTLTRLRPDAQRDRNRELVAAVVAEAAARGWECCGDLLPPALRRTNAFAVLPDEHRFALMVIRDLESGCWLWTGATTGGYGKFTYRRRAARAHRVSYELHRGRLAGDVHLDHLCLNKRCVNPDHLDPVTQQENTRRWAVTITHCPQGHPYDEANTYVRSTRLRGKRECRTCSAASSIRARASKRTSAPGAGRKIKLSDEDIVEMRRMRSEGARPAAIAARFGISKNYAIGLLTGANQRRRRYTGPGAQATRVIRDRAAGWCEFPGCPATAEHTHHRRPRRIGSTRRPETNLPANLLRLCSGHHEWVESNRREALAMGLLLHDSQTPAAVPCQTRHGFVLLADDGTWETA